MTSHIISFISHLFKCYCEKIEYKMSYERGWGNLEGNSTKDVLEFDRVLALPVATYNNATSHTQ